MRVTKWTEYGIVLLQRLALIPPNPESGVPDQANVRSLAEVAGVPQDFAEQIMLKLRAAGIVDSKRGRLGGYVLNVAPSMLSMSTVFNAFEPDTFTVDADTDARIRPVLVKLQTAIYACLDGLTLANTTPEM
jgi:Rrf2 family protein